MRNCLTFTLLSMGVFFLQLACRPTSSASSSSPGQITKSFPYDLAAGRHDDMPKSLAEISGITFHPSRSQLIYAIQDEDGILYSYDRSQKKVLESFTFGKPGDYEDLITDGDFFYILRSDGTLFSFPFGYLGQRDQVKSFKGLLPKGEYESLGMYSSKRELYVLCKECPVDKKSGNLTGYTLLMGDGGDLKRGGQFTIPMTSIQKLDPDVRKTIKPSAMTRKASTNEWYILSSIDKLLLITDSAFRPLEVIRFSREDFEQPEGIAFDEQENLFISSEAGKQNRGRIYQFNKK
ncbi:SdiA-regulated domain-containing protein [Sphingobacterium bambusae]|uniref:SdiA-regulated domain-containing protein n=1 Tax=Sphingobacterium bambusae TaxID=662858 RepID=A0ABW6BPF2_9SPHI|nr:SdiA-regulated domain-containing protein [Sphingobacterium bambusae]WPL48131.1 SdiA-regulated domain-containing protein [Sphingobacterium bambusae]